MATNPSKFRCLPELSTIWWKLKTKKGAVVFMERYWYIYYWRSHSNVTLAYKPIYCQITGHIVLKADDCDHNGKCLDQVLNPWFWDWFETSWLDLSPIWVTANSCHYLRHIWFSVFWVNLSESFFWTFA